MNARKKILFVGLTCLDIINICEKYPLEDEDSRATQQYWQKGGNAANSASVAAQFKDTDVSLFSSLSSSYEGNYAKSQLIEMGVDVSVCPQHQNIGFPTSCCILSQTSGTRTIVHCRNDLPELTVIEFRKHVNLNQYDWIHFETRGLPDICEMISLAGDYRDENKTLKVSIEIEKPKYLNQFPDDLLSRLDVLFISKDIATSLDYHSAEEAVHKIRNEKHIDKRVVVICPWGDKGVDAVDENGNYYHCDAFNPGQLRDTLGAGDTFIAGVLHGLIHDKPLKKCLEKGCMLAGKKCGQIGYNGIVDC